MTLEEALAERKKIAAELSAKQGDAKPSGDIRIASLASMLDSLDVTDPTLGWNAQVVSYDGAAVAATDLPGYGRIRPLKGGTLLMMSTGSTIPETFAEPGTDHGAPGLAGDSTRFIIRLSVPIGLNRLSFDYNFLSAESPEFIGMSFNDTFSVFVTDAQGRREVARAEVSNADFHPSSATNIGENPFLLYTDIPAGVDNFLPNQLGAEVDTGVTDFRRADVGVSNGVITVEFEIHDVGDGILDSAVFIDNLSLSAVEPVDPLDGLIDEFGQVIRPGSSLIANEGTPVHSVVADGVTQVLLRAKVPPAGTALFTVEGGDARDGQVSPNQDTLVWGASANGITPVVANGQPYVYALYRSPADFNRGTSHPGDATAKARNATVVMTFTPPTGPAITQRIPMGIVRPPVVVIPELWTTCTQWRSNTGSLMSSNIPDANQPFNISCHDYDATAPKGLVANRTVVSAAVNQALNKLRETGVAATQVDLVGHGLGGLLARRYIDELGFRRFNNFFEGSINRLIMLHTPNLGMRFADEAVRMRDYAKGQSVNDVNVWTQLSALLKDPNDPDHLVLIDDDECSTTPQGVTTCNRILDDLTTTNDLLKAIGTNATNGHVGYHAIVGTDGRSVARNVAHNTLFSPSQPKRLYTGMEDYHPTTFWVPPLNPITVRQRLLFGTLSAVFCNNTVATVEDQHDLLTTTNEQAGGLPLPADGVATPPTQASPTTMFSTIGTLGTTTHFNVSNNPNHTARIQQLLNTPVASGFFAPTMARVGTLTPVNHCPNPPQYVPPGLMMASPPPRALAQRSVIITAPVGGADVTPGGTVTVTVATGGEGVAERVLVVGGGEVITIDGPPPFTASFPVPQGAFGTLTLKAYAFYDLGDLAPSAPVTVDVVSNAQLLSLEVLNGNAVLESPGEQRQLRVLGTFSDGVQRDLTRAVKGTLYTRSSLTQAVNVSPDGLITAIGPGDATIIVRNGGKITSINVEVKNPCGNGVIDGSETCDDGDRESGDGCSASCQIESSPPVAVCSSPSVCNDPGVCSANVTGLGAGSTDPDDDALSFEQNPAGPYSVGQHAVQVSVSDGIFTRTCTSEVDVNDCEAPSLSCPGNFAVECTGAGGATVTPPGATASDNCNDATVTAPTPAHLTLGTHALAYSAVDGAGNPATCSSEVTVQDTTAPIVTCPAPTVAECSGGGAATVTPGAGSATDVCTTAAVSGPGPGSYPLGTTPISYTATDLSGNQATCASAVTVIDSLAPTLTCPAPTVAECTGAGHAVVDPGDATASDVCAAVAVSDPGPSAFPLGTTSVSYTATDAGGNQTACATTVTVRDTTPPEGFSDGAPPLSPPDHEYRTVRLSDCNISVIDACGGPLPPSIHRAQINCVTSDEPDDAPGGSDGNTHNDIIVVDGQTVRLRAESDGNDDGRLYNIYFKIEDAQGNRINGVCPVEVRAANCPPGDPSCGPTDSGGKHAVCL